MYVEVETLLCFTCARDPLAVSWVQITLARDSRNVVQCGDFAFGNTPVCYQPDHERMRGLTIAKHDTPSPKIFSSACSSKVIDQMREVSRTISESAAAHAREVDEALQVSRPCSWLMQGSGLRVLNSSVTFKDPFLGGSRSGNEGNIYEKITYISSVNTPADGLFKILSFFRFLDDLPHEQLPIRGSVFREW